MLPAGSLDAVEHRIQASAPEDGRNHHPKRVELIGIINKPLLLRLVGCLYYCGFSDVFFETATSRLRCVSAACSKTVSSSHV